LATAPENHESHFELWDLTVFRYGGTYLDMTRRLKAKEPAPRGVMPLIMRVLNRVFTGMLVEPGRTGRHPDQLTDDNSA
jgi:hypothetical protein